MAIVASRSVAQLVEAHWLAAQNGSWLDPANWSSNPNVPRNGAPNPASAYEALIDAVGSSYTVSLDLGSAGQLAVTKLTLASADATVALQSGRFASTSGAVVNTGTFRLAGGTLSSTQLLGAGGSAVAHSGVLEQVTVGRDLLIPVNTYFGDPPAVKIQSGLTFANGATVRMNAPGGMGTGYSGVELSGSQTFSGTGTFDQNGGFMGLKGSLTIAPGVTWLGSALNYYNSSIVNRGTLRASGGGQKLLVLEDDGYYASSFVNEGLIEALPGTGVAIEGHFRNPTGTVRANGGAVVIGMAFLNA